MVDARRRRTLWLSLLAVPSLVPVLRDAEGAPAASPPKPPAPPAPLVPVSETDPLAQALGFKQDAARVDARYFPTRQLPASRNQFCGDCLLFRPVDANWGHCVVMIPQGVVNVIGWCGRWTSAQPG